MSSSPPSTAPAWLFVRVPETKAAKNRMHLDLDCDDLLAARLELEVLGATFVHEKDEYGVHWMTFQDPEGNEFCVAAHATNQDQAGASGGEA